MVGIIIALIVVYGFILFRNSIDLNNVTIEFTILFVTGSLILLLFWKERKGILRKYEHCYLHLINLTNRGY